MNQSFEAHNAAIVIRDGIWHGQAVKIGGIGGVATREDCRQCGARGVFCEPRHGPLYEKLGWHPFKGDVLLTEPGGRVRFEVTEPYVFDLKIAPRSGVLDLCGLPW